MHGVSDPFLVVVPLSTLAHWQREICDWTELHSVVFHGSKEAREVILEWEWAAPPSTSDGGGQKRVSPAALSRPCFDVCVTTYETLTIAADVFRRVPKWGALVLDEAHRLKNRDSKALGVLKTLNYKSTVAMTGTPLQNNVGELWTMLNLLDEAKFPSLEAFIELYGDMHSAEQVSALTQKLRPYLLRRTKADVDLGVLPMEETLITVEITNFQKQCYRALLEQNRSLLLRGANAVSGPSFNNLSMQLRHCCNHPFLIKGVMESEGLLDADDDTYCNRLVEASGKLVLLDKLLPRLKEQGNRVLIFSQFTMLLDLLENYIRLRGYFYERLDGSITGERRQAAIDRFTSPDSESFIFLLGTRAGGVGINLTAADTVILYDPDWNPQNDIQAQARCHRIGQTKVVRIYRLVTRGTYEASMAERANQKLGLEQAIIGSHNYGAGTEGAATDADGGAETTVDAKAQRHKKAKEIEELLKHGAQNLFTDEHDKRVEAFSSETIDDILSRSATSRTDAGSKAPGAPTSSFAQASFTTNEGSSLDMDDPNFWQQVLGDEAKPEEVEEAIDYDDLGPRTRPRRSVGEPQRLAPSWETAAASVSPEPPEPPEESARVVKPKASKPKRRDAWTRAQVLIRRHTPFSPYDAPRFRHMSEINSLF